MGQLTITDIAIVPVVAGVVEVIKRSIPITVVQQAAPLMSLLLGIAIAVALGGISAESVIIGLVYGLSASGLYSQVKTLKSVNLESEDVLE